MTTPTPNAPKAAAPAVAEAAEQAKLWISQVVIAAHRRSPAQTKVAVEALEAFIDLLAAAPQQVAAWMPISTAPKDGTAIYVVVANALKPEAGVAHWFSDTWRGGQAIDWQGTENPHEHFGVYPSPTHWQPLPAPPSQASATGEV